MPHKKTRLKPDSVVTFEFPELPRTLQSVIDEEEYVARASAYLPRDYEPGRALPVVCFLGGAGGGHGENFGSIRSVLQDREFVCINLPHFKRRVAKLQRNEKNKWMRMYLRPCDTKIIWDSYAVMLERIFSAIPNLDRGRAFLGGFSNGAHATALLLNGRFEGIREYFGGFFLIEGGNRLEPDEKLAGLPLLLMQGEKQESLDLPRLAQALETAGACTEFHWMKGVGHAFPEKDHKVLRRWLRRHAQM